MAIKAGQILHDAQGFVVDRIQTGGVSNLNIPQEKVYETGNYSSVATVRDIPELTFEVEQLDVSTEMEALITGQDPSATLAGDEFDFTDAIPLDIISPFKAGSGAFNIIKGIVIPYLTLETVSYRYAVRQNAQQTFTFRGDSVYYVPGSPYYQEITLVNNTLTYSLAHNAITYVENGDDIRVLSACVKNPSTGAYKRLFFGASNTDGYTNTTNSITLNQDYFDAGYTKLHVTYGSSTAANYDATVHEGTDVKPAAVRAKNICLYVSDGAATPQLLQWSGVQSFELTRQVNLDNNEEFCNSKYVSIDYDVADVNGNVVTRDVDADELWSKIAQIANVSESEIVGPFSSQPLEMEVTLSDPDTGDVVKTLYVPDARFTIPNMQARVQTKLETTFNWQSDSGTVLVYDGERP